MSRAAGRSLVFAVLLALVWIGAESALALTLEDRVSAELGAIHPSTRLLTAGSGVATPLTVIEERPDPKAGDAQTASQIYGSQLDLTVGSGSTLGGSVFFSKSLPLYETLGGDDQAGLSELTPGLLALRGAGAEHVIASGRAMRQKLDYSAGAFKLQGSYLDVDKDFRTPGSSSVSVIGERSPVDELAALRGMTELQFQGEYNPTGALSLTTSRRKFANEQPDHKEVGMVISEVAHALTYALGSERQFKADFQHRDEDWRDHGSINIEKLMAHFDAAPGLALTYSRDWGVNNREGHKEKGLTRDIVKRSLAYQLTGRTRLDVNYDSIAETWDRGDHLDATEKEVRDYALHHAFSGSTKANLMRNLTSVTSGDTTTDIDTTQLHLEHKPGARLNLAADWMDRSRSDGTTEDLTKLALDSVIGSGRGKMALKGLYEQHTAGLDDKQVDTRYRLGLTAAPSALLNLKADYESLNQQGPTADHDFVRTNLNLTSQLHRYAKLTADYARETDEHSQTKSDHGAKIELNPGWLALSAGFNLRERQGEADLTTTSGDLNVKFGQKLADWAKALSCAEPIPAAGHYGHRGAPGWAKLGDGALALSYIARSADDEPHDVVTRSLGYRTMLGRHAYLGLARHNNPMVKKDNKLVMESARWDMYEGGLDLGSGFAALGRVLREKDLDSGSAIRARVLGMRGAIGGGRLAFVGGLQTLRTEDGAATDWRFGNFNLKLGHPLADWAKQASNGGLFDDNVEYGYRKLPEWAAFTDGGLNLRYMEREAEGGEKLMASAAGYQTMLGQRTYLRLSLQQNPLTDKGEVISVDRKLYEIGRRFGGKFTALARYISDDDLAEAKSLRSSMLALRGRLSQRERLETVFVLDDVVSQGERYRTTTYGLQYAREAGEGHYLIIKGTLTRDDQPGIPDDARDDYQVDFAYKKEI